MPTWIYFTPEKDAYIAQYYPDINFGDVPYLYTNRYQGCNDEYQSLIKFDLCSLGCNQIPSNSEINPTRLYLKIYRNEIPHTTRLYAYRIMQYWDENTVTWNNKPMVDYSQAVGHVDIDAGYFGWVNMELNYNIVQKWYNGYYRNYGLLLKCEEPCDSLIGFYSREFYNPDYWPMLGICYYQNCCYEPENGSF